MVATRRARVVEMANVFMMDTWRKVGWKCILGKELKSSWVLFVSWNQLLGKVELCDEKKEVMRVRGASIYSSR